MEENIKIIKQEDWKQEQDGLWYAHIPCECSDDTDYILELSDDNDYIDEHKEDFDSLHDGVTKDNECIISADKQPSCDIKFTLNTLEEAGGKILYDKNGVPEYIPPKQPDIAEIMSALNSNSKLNPAEVYEAIAKKSKNNDNIEVKD